jgi:AcrR family transcriptional regulator
LRQALLALLESTPLEQITIRDIAAAAGVGYTTYYRHYTDKEALLRDLAAEEVRRLSELTIPVYDEADSRAACLALCAYVDGRRSLWSALLTGASGFVREEMLRQGREAAAERPPGWLPGDLGIVLSATVIVELLAWWLRQPDPPPAALMADVLDRTVISPAAP